MEDQVEQFLELYPSLEDALEALDISPLEAVTILVSQGYARLPPFLDNDSGEENGQEE